MMEQTWKILMVDDDEDDYLLTRDMLKSAKHGKYDLEWANTYDDGWRSIQFGTYDAVLMDYDMGAHTGLDLIRKATEQDCPTPIILYTGRGTYEADIQAMQAGAALYLTKSEVNPLLLERGIRYAIERKRAQMQLRHSEKELLKANEDLMQELQRREQAERELEEKSRKLEETLERQKLLAEAGAELLAGADPIERLEDFFQRISHSLGLEVYVQYNLSADGTHLELGQIGGIPPTYLPVLKQLELGQAVCGTVAQTRKPMYVDNVQQSDDRKVRLIRTLGIGTYACHPLIVDNRLLGTLSFGSRTLSHFEPETIDLLRTFCSMVANSLFRKSTESALRRERELLQKLFERIPVMITMYHPDLEMVQFNQKFEELIGWSTEEARQADFNLMEKFYPDPEYRKQVEIYMRSLEGGWRDLEVTAKNGEVVDSSWTNVLLSDDTQIGIGIDIRERKRAERNLRLSEERFSKAFNATPTALVISRMVDGQIQSINDAFERLFGYRREEVLGKTSLELNMFAEPASRSEAIRIVKNDRKLRNFEVTIRQKSGETRQASLSVEILTVEDEEYLLTVIEDLTEKVQLMSEQERLKAKIASLEDCEKDGN